MSHPVRSFVFFRRSRSAVLAGSIALAGAAALLTVPRAEAATSSNWSNANGGTWNLGTNWSAGIPGATAGDTANLNLNIAGARTVTMDVSETLGTLTIGDTDNSGAYTLNTSNSAVLTFNNNTSAAVLTMGGNSAGDTITVPFVLTGDLNIANNAAINVLTLNGASITTSGTGTKKIATSGSGGDIAIAAAIGGGTGDISLSKAGTNNLILSGANTFGGGVTLTAGTLTLNNATALGSAASTLTINGGALAGNATLSNANAIAWSANMSFVGTGSLNLGAATTTVSGSRVLTLGATNGATLTFANGIAQGATASLTFANAGTQTTSAVQLNGTNGYTGGTIINGGSIGFGVGSIPTTGNITINANGALQVGGAYTTLAGWMGETRLVKSASGAFALTVDSAEDFAPAASGFANISLGASAGKTVSYTGTYTPGTNGYLLGGGGGTLVFSNADALTGSAAATIGNGGGGTVVIGNSNDSYTGVVTIANGALQLGNGSNTGTLNGVTSFISNSVLAFNRSDNVAFNTSVSGTGGITKLGANTLTIGNANSYTGATTIATGTLTFSVAQNLSGPLVFGTAAGATTVGTLSLGTANATFGGMTVQTNTTSANTITIGSGRTLTVNGNVTVGYNLGPVPATTPAVTTKLTVSGAGALVVSGTASIFSVGTNQTTQLNSATSSIVDLSGLSSVSLGTVANPISEVRVAYSQSNNGTMLLSNTANTIAATSLNVGNSNQVVGGTGILTLGNGTNVIQADNINIGFSKNNGTIAFASASAGTGTVVIGNKAANGGANITVGSQNGTATAANLVGTLDLRGHNSTVNAATLTIGNNNNINSSGSANGVVNFDTGTFSAATVNLGLKSGSSTGSNTTNAINLSGTGVFNVSGATSMSGNTATAAGNLASALNITGGTYNTGTLILANKNGTGTGTTTGTISISNGALNVFGNSFVLAVQSGASTAAGTLTITGGTVTTAADITDGGGATTTAITLDGGTLDLTGHNIGSAGTPIDTVAFKSGALVNVNQINGTGGLTKVAGAGSNTLSLYGTNHYTGATTVSAGNLYVNGSINGSTVAVSSGATLGGYGHISLDAGESVAVNGLLAPGASSYGELTVSGGDGVTLNSATLAIDVITGFQDKLTIDGGATSNFTIAGTNNTLAINAGKPGTFTIASWTGTRSGFFDLITINGGNEAYTKNTVGSITTYTFTSGDGTLTYDDNAKNLTLSVNIPEPASVLSLAGGCAALLGLTRSRRRRK